MFDSCETETASCVTQQEEYQTKKTPMFFHTSENTVSVSLEDVCGDGLTFEVATWSITVIRRGLHWSGMQKLILRFLPLTEDIPNIPQLRLKF